MAQVNPYAPPAANVDAFLVNGPSGHAFLARSQKLLVYAALACLVAIPLGFKAGWLSVMVSLAALFVGVLGMIGVGVALGWPILARVGLILLLFLPLINLLTVLLVNAKASRVLRNAGYSVGLLGATPPTRRPAADS